MNGQGLAAGWIKKAQGKGEGIRRMVHLRQELITSPGPVLLREHQKSNTMR